MFTWVVFWSKLVWCEMVPFDEKLHFNNDILTTNHMDILKTFLTRFLSFSYVQKVSRLKFCLVSQKWRMNETLISFKIVPLLIHTYIPGSILLVKAPLEFFFWYDIKLYHCIDSNVFRILKSYPRDDFSV